MTNAMTEKESDDDSLNGLTDHADNSATLTQERKRIALEAAWELHGISKHLLALDATTENMDLVKRGLCVRVGDLADVVCAALNLPGHRIEQLHRKLGSKPA